MSDKDVFTYQAVADDELIQVIFLYEMKDVTHSLSTQREYIRGELAESITSSEGASMSVLGGDPCTASAPRSRTSGWWQKRLEPLRQ